MSGEVCETVATKRGGGGANRKREKSDEIKREKTDEIKRKRISSLSDEDFVEVETKKLKRGVYKYEGSANLKLTFKIDEKGVMIFESETEQISPPVDSNYKIIFCI